MELLVGQGVGSASKAINLQYLLSLSLSGDGVKGKIDLNEGGTTGLGCGRSWSDLSSVCSKRRPELLAAASVWARTISCSWPANCCFSAESQRVFRSC